MAKRRHRPLHLAHDAAGVSTHDTASDVAGALHRVRRRQGGLYECWELPHEALALEPVRDRPRGSGEPLGQKLDDLLAIPGKGGEDIDRAVVGGEHDLCLLRQTAGQHLLQPTEGEVA